MFFLFFMREAVSSIADAIELTASLTKFFPFLMKIRIRNLLLFLSPFLFMVLVNEFSEPTLGSGIRSATHCSWHCHDNTFFCKEFHVKFAKPHFKIIDLLYNGMIEFLDNAGDYQFSNIFFLVVLWPLLMYFLLIQNLDMRLKIKKLNT